MVDMKKKATDILEDYSNSYSQVDLETLTKFLEQIKAEAITEFAERLKAKAKASMCGVVCGLDIDQTAKEMKGGGSDA